MKLSRILGIALYIYLLLTVGLFAFYGENYLINIQSILWITLSVILLWFLLSIKHAESKPLITLLVFVNLVWYLARFLFLIVSPENMGFEQHYINVDDMNRGLIYFFLGTMLIGLGFKIGSTFNIHGREKQYIASNSISFDISFRKLVMFAVAVIMVTLYNCYALGVGRFGDVYSGWVFRLVSYDAILLILIVTAGEKWPFLHKRQKTLLLLVFALFLAVKVLMFSRGAFYLLLTYGMFFYWAKQGDFVITRKHIIIIGVFILASILVYPFATSTRAIWTSEKSSSISFKDVIGFVGFSDFTISDLLEVISFRLSALDRVVVVVGDKGSNVSQYANLGNVTKSIVNLTVPGTPFPDAMLTSQAFSIIYFGLSENYIREHEALTSLWTLYGTCYAHFGWYGGLFSMFVLSFALAAVYQKICRLKTPYNMLLRTWFIMLIYNALLSYGLDTWWLDGFHLMLIAIVYMAILSFDKVILGGFRRCFGVLKGNPI